MRRIYWFFGAAVELSGGAWNVYASGYQFLGRCPTPGRAIWLALQATPEGRALTAAPTNWTAR